MKTFTRIEPTTVQTYGERFQRKALVKRFRTEDGKVHEFTTEGAENSHAGAAIALTTDNLVIIVYQFRAGPERWLYDIPGGGIDDGEDFQAGVMRELEEETGYVPGKMEYLGDSMRNAYFNTVWHYYLATECVPGKKGREMELLESDQGAELRFISIDELLEHAKKDRMCDPHAVLMAYDRLMELKEG